MNRMESLGPVLRFSLCLGLGLGLILAIGMAGPAAAGTNDNAVIALHAAPVPAGKAPPVCGSLAPVVPCSEYLTSADADGITMSYVYVVAAMGDSSGIRGASFGVQYDGTLGSGIDMVTWYDCSDLWFRDSNTWPDSGSGTRVTWASYNCQDTAIGDDGVHAVIGAFQVVAYGEDVLEITPNNDLITPELKVADCSGAESADIPVTRTGKVRFTPAAAAPGFNPCADCSSLVCIDLSLGTIYAGFLDTSYVHVSMTNCGTYTTDLVVNYSVDGTPQTPISYPGVNPSEIRAFDVPVVCLESGVHTVSCTVDAVLSADPTCSRIFSDSASIACYYPPPLISAIDDIGNDQGKQVRITFQKSGFDTVGLAFSTVQYEVYRRIDPLPNEGVGAGPPAARTATARTPRLTPLAAGWDYLAAVPAHREDEYSAVVPTLADSTISSGMHWSAFFVRAASSDPGIFGDSPPDSGYSLDNLAPAAPQGLVFTAPGLLTWEEAPETDFGHFTVYGSESPDFGEALLIDVTTETTLDVQQETYAYYYVTATDHSGNEGPAAGVLNTVGITGEFIPRAYALTQNWPNPFHASTTIQLDLPEASRVRVEVFDVRGRLVTRLVDGEMPAGRHGVSWNGADDRGKRVSPGIYFYRMSSQRFSRTLKAILVR